MENLSVGPGSQAGWLFREKGGGLVLSMKVCVLIPHKNYILCWLSLICTCSGGGSWCPWGGEGYSTVLNVSGAGGAEGLGAPATATAASSLAAQPSSVLTYATAI